MPDFKYADVAKMIDHSLLNPTLTLEDTALGCRLARDYDVASVCVMPHAAALATGLLEGSGVYCSTTIGFPHGGHTTSVKVAEARQALADGATELDMVVNIGRVLGGDWAFVRDDLQAVIETAHAANAKVKVIFENFYLQDVHKIRLCELASELYADWVKTSTGYAGGGATMEDLTLMRKHAAPGVQVKAAGGIRDLDALLKVRALGVTRCGATRTAAMMDDARRRLQLEPIVSSAIPQVPGY